MPPTINDLDVPILMHIEKESNLEMILFAKENEILVDLILPRIDGYRYVLSIAEESKVDSDIVKMVL